MTNLFIFSHFLFPLLYLLALTPLGILVAIAFIYFMVFFFIDRSRQKQRREKSIKLFSDKGPFMEATLVKFNSFYRALKSHLKERFIMRTIEFMQSKTFVYHSVSKDEELEILVSAAAIQVSFGLKNYLLAYFKKIHILGSDYQYGQYNLPFMGHVDHTGIYLSINNFI